MALESREFAMELGIKFPKNISKGELFASHLDRRTLSAVRGVLEMESNRNDEARKRVLTAGLRLGALLNSLGNVDTKREAMKLPLRAIAATFKISSPAARLNPPNAGTINLCQVAPASTSFETPGEGVGRGRPS